MPEPTAHQTAPQAKPVPLSRSAILIGIMSLLSDISSQMIYPVLPIFLTQILHTPATVVGLIEGITNGVANLVPVVSGWLADRFGRRKPIAFCGFILSALSRPVIGLATVWGTVFAARAADRIGKGIRSAPKQAMLAEAALDSERGRVFGFDRAMDYLGSVIGPLIGLLMLGVFGLSERSIFFIAAIPALLAAFMLLAVREPRVEVKAQNGRSSFTGLTRQFKLFLVVTAIFGLANSANSFLILRAQQLGLTTTLAILAYALFNAVSSLFSMPAGSASDKFGRRNLLLIGYAIYALVYVGFGAANQVWMMWPLFVLYGLFPALTDGVAKALAVDTAGRAGRATAIGVFSAVNGVTQIAASYIGGMLWDNINPQATFYFGAILATLAVVLLFLLLPSRLVETAENRIVSPLP
ncbi:MAG: MFS transporter [Acidobacteria bacterium]|nr:MFS transporter [Acidobacteriota bacterium]